ncbi:MAG: polyprenyl synthetase family protein [Myxococcota bacterium]
MPDLHTDLERLRDDHLEAIRELITLTVARESPPQSSLVEMCAYHLSTGGKRLRALLPLAVAEALDVDAEQLIPFGAACELLHNATLVHDDLQDGDTTRRGHEAAWVKYGEARAINLGDAMLYWTLLLVRQLDADPADRERLSTRLLRETVRVVDGQEREFLLKDADAPLEADYFRMVEGKTSGLFALPIAGAAEFCGANNRLVEALEEAAGHLGVLFQIQDDVLDLYADKGREHRGTDICEGKISALVVHFLNNAPADKAAWLRTILDAPRDDVTLDQIDDVADAFREYGSLEYALGEIERRRRLALDDETFEDYPRVKQLLHGIAEVFLKPIDAVEV